MIILSDIHANLNAFNAVLRDMERRYPDERDIALLGDCINYGMRPNDVIDNLRQLGKRYDIVCNLFGNHEKALLDRDTTHFSTDRGRQVLDYTRGILSEQSMAYLQSMNPAGYCELTIGGRKCLFVHGSIDDPFWGKLNAKTVDDIRYKEYDFVISGHSHVPQLIEQFFEDERPDFRNKKRTVFINPGSVGQPRNHNRRAQYAYVDLENEIFQFNAVEYDIAQEQSLYPDTIHSFYKERLTNGI